MTGGTPDSLFLDVNIHAALLNLIALPACGYFMVLLAGPRSSNRTTMFMGLSFFILTYGILLTKSRGGILAFLVCAGILLFIAWRHVPRRVVAIAAGLIALAYLFADLSWAGGLTERAQTLADLREAGAGRFAIWRQSWLLLQEQSPFWGVGLGIYSLLWPPYRAPQDSSAGYFVHNDYLQIWIEAGLPGLLLFLMLLGGASWTMVRILGNARLPRAARLETIGLGMGLAAIALHSLVQYNFYVVPILLLCGLGLARLQELEMAHAVGKPKPWRIQPAKYFSVPRLSGGSYFWRRSCRWDISPPSAYRHISLRIGVMLAEAGRTDEAEQALIVAHRFWPDADAPLFMRADLYRFMLMQSTNEGMTPRRKVLFDTADELLGEAERRNPFRPHIFTLRAELIAWRLRLSVHRGGRRSSRPTSMRFASIRASSGPLWLRQPLFGSQGEVRGPGGSGGRDGLYPPGKRTNYALTEPEGPIFGSEGRDAHGAGELHLRIDGYRKSREHLPGG